MANERFFRKGILEKKDGNYAWKLDEPNFVNVQYDLASDLYDFLSNSSPFVFLAD